MNNWQHDKKWSDKFIPQIKQIVGPKLLVPSSLEVDQKESADLVVLTGRNITVACRIRSYGYLPRFYHQFTIRSQRDSGAKTELQKMTDGYGDWMFYAHSNRQENDFDLWWLLDLWSWRGHQNKNIISGDCHNGDGTHFKWFDIRSFKGQPKLVVDSSHVNGSTALTIERHVIQAPREVQCALNLT